MTKAKTVQLVQVCRARRGRAYEIRTWAKLTPKGGGWGRVPRAAMMVGPTEPDERLVQAVLSELEVSGTLVYDESAAPKLSPNDAAEFARSHDVIAVGSPAGLHDVCERTLRLGGRTPVGGEHALRLRLRPEDVNLDRVAVAGIPRKRSAVSRQSSRSSTAAASAKASSISPFQAVMTFSSRPGLMRRSRSVKSIPRPRSIGDGTRAADE